MRMKKEVYKLPLPFLEKLKNIYPQNFPAICQTFLRKKLHSFRINYLKTDLMSLKKMLAREGVRYRELSWPEGSFILKSKLAQLQSSSVYQKGFIYVQNISSMIPPVVLAPRKGERILDLCAAPGAKTTQIFSLTEGSIELVAIEKIRVRYYKLLANLKIQGADSVRCYMMDGLRVRKKFPEYFDKVLVDAPCSSEGLFYVNNPHSFKYWKERKVKEMSHKQKKLLSSAFYALKEGGELVYSTCTFSPEENEEVIDWLVNKFKERIEILPIRIPLKNTMPGLKRWRSRTFSSDLRFTLRIIPTEFMEGFFIAHLKKQS